MQNLDVEEEELFGKVLADLLTSSTVGAKATNLGDSFTISMIRDNLAADFSNLIVDASEAPCLVCNFKQAVINNSESDSESGSDSTESVGPESDSSSSESGTSGSGNPDAKVLSWSFFSVWFESTVTEDPDFLKGNAGNVAYFSVPLVCCIDLNFQNFDINEEEEIPWVLKILVDHEEERHVKPCTDEIVSINVGTEEDPRLVQIGSTLFLEERERLIALLKDFKDVFVWSYENMLGIDPKIV